MPNVIVSYVTVISIILYLFWAYYPVSLIAVLAFTAGKKTNFRLYRRIGGKSPVSPRSVITTPDDSRHPRPPPSRPARPDPPSPVPVGEDDLRSVIKSLDFGSLAVDNRVPATTDIDPDIRG